MAGNFTPIYRCEESLLIQGPCITSCAISSRPRRGTSDRIATCSSESFLGGTSPIRTCCRSYWEVCCCTTVRRSPHSHFSVEERWTFTVRVRLSRGLFIASVLRMISALYAIPLTFGVFTYLLPSFL